MTHPVFDGPITILKVVTPGCYWIKCQNCCGSSRIPESIRQKPYSEDFYPPNGAKVLVHDEEGFFYQGTICGRGEFPMFASMQARKYAVQLTHTFQVKDFDRSNIYPTFGERSFGCESAHLISLKTVLPEFPPPEFGSSKEAKNAVACQSFEDKIRNWDKSNDVVEDLIQNRCKFWYKQLQVINGSMYGEITYFEKFRYINVKDFLATKKIAVRTSFRFEIVVQSLMKRPLQMCCNPLPVYSPNIPLISLVRPVVPVTPVVEKNPYDLKQFQVHIDDLKTHQDLWTDFSSNILFTDICEFRKGCVPVRYVAPDGNICLGTVLSPNVTYNEQCEMEKPLDYEFKNFLRQQSVRCEYQSFNSGMCYENTTHCEMPPSTDESSVSSLSLDKSMFEYEFEEAVTRFRQRGGLLEDYISLSSLLPTSQSLLDVAESLFDYLDVLELKDWQLACLPSLLSKKNVVIIGPQSQGKMTTSIISTLSLMNESTEKNGQNSTSPIFILLVDDYKRAVDAARLCKSLMSDLNVMITTYCQISEAQIQETQLGCDVLISTPRNWLKLCGDLDCFNYSNLAHVMFDSFEKLYKDYPSEIQTILENLKLTNHVQAIFLLNVWGSFIVKCVNSLGNATRCVIDIVQSCFCYNVVPTIVIAPEDWEELLASIIIKDINLGLLLCNDHNEVAAIMSRVDHLDSVLFVHENEDTDSVKEKIEVWKSNEKTFLISSDILFSKLDFVQKANLLVSWKQDTCSRSTLITRFMSIRGHKIDKLFEVPIYIFCSRDNLEELVFIKRLLSFVKKPEFLGGDLDECIASNFKDRENLKMGKLCISFCMFGRCDLTPLCHYRHDFRQQDSIHGVQSQTFLNVTLVKLHSAFHMTVRVQSIIFNQESNDSAVIHSFKSNLPEIEMSLKSAFGSNGMTSSNFTENLKVGDVVGALVSEDENTFRRVKITSVGENNNEEGLNCDVSVLDYDEPCLKLSVNHIFPIPSETASHPRDIVDIFLSKLVPVDFKTSWVFETKSFLTNYIELIATHSIGYPLGLLAGAVELVLDRSIVVDTIHWCRIDGTDEQATYIMETSLKDVLLTSNYVKENPEHLEVLLSKLAVDCGKQPFGEIAEEKFGFRKNFPPGFNKGTVSAFDNPGLFYVQLSSEKENLMELESSLNSSLDRYRRRLSVIGECQLCCVKIDGIWNRALIIEMYCINASKARTCVTVLCVDYGDTRPSIDAHDLYCLPDEFLGIPYYAIECQLLGILPKNGPWSDEEVDKFETCIRDSNNCMITVDLKFCGAVKENHSTKHFRHQVALRRPEDKDTINQQLVCSGMGRWDEATVDLLIHREKPIRLPSRRRMPFK